MKKTFYIILLLLAIVLPLTSCDDEVVSCTIDYVVYANEGIDKTCTINIRYVDPVTGKENSIIFRGPMEKEDVVYNGKTYSLYPIKFKIEANKLPALCKVENIFMGDNFPEEGETVHWVVAKKTTVTTTFSGGNVVTDEIPLYLYETEFVKS